MSVHARACGSPLRHAQDARRRAAAATSGGDDERRRQRRRAIDRKKRPTREARFRKGERPPTTKHRRRRSATFAHSARSAAQHYVRRPRARASEDARRPPPAAGGRGRPQRSIFSRPFGAAMEAQAKIKTLNERRAAAPFRSRALTRRRRRSHAAARRARYAPSPNGGRVKQKTITQVSKRTVAARCPRPLLVVGRGAHSSDTLRMSAAVGGGWRAAAAPRRLPPRSRSSRHSRAANPRRL